MAKYQDQIYIGLLAAMLGGLSATQGLNHDTAIYFKTALRIIEGQVLYQDFFLPQGFVAGFVAALGFIWLPVGWAIVFLSGFLNAVASLLIYQLTRNGTGERGCARLAGVLTAIWFVTIIGTFYNDHLGYLFIVAGFICHSQIRNRFWAALLTGASIVLAYHCKQTIGITGALSIVLVELIFPVSKNRIRNIAAIVASTLSWQILFVGYFYASGKLDNYIIYAIQSPIDYAISEKNKNVWDLFIGLAVPWKMVPKVFPGFGQLAFFPLVACFYFCYALMWRLRKQPLQRELRLLAFFVFSTLLCSSLLGRYHGHLFLGAGGAIAISIHLVRHIRHWQVFRTVVVTIIIVCALCQMLPNRKPFLKSNAFFEQTSLWPVRVVNGPTAKETERILKKILKDPGDIAVFTPIPYYLSLALGKAGKSPTVYVEGHLTIPGPPSVREKWQKQVIASLILGSPKHLVLDRFWKRHRKAFPLLTSFFMTHYRPSFSTTRISLMQKSKPSQLKVSYNEGKS